MSFAGLLCAIAPLSAANESAFSEPAASTARAEGELYVRAAELHLGDGRVLLDGVLHVERGKVKSVGRGVEVPSDRPHIIHDGVLTAGFIACRSGLGLTGESHDSTRAVLPEARIADAWSPAHSDFERALEHGITTVVLAPSSGNVAGGVTAVAKTDGSALVAREAHLSLSFTGAPLVRNRQPTSYSGAVAELDRLFQEPDGVAERVAGGHMPVFAYASSLHQLTRALRFLERHELGGVIVGCYQAGEIAERVKASGLGVVLPTHSLSTSQRNLRSSVALAEAQVPLAFTYDASPNRDPLRLSAALCVRAGMDRNAALRALCADAARLAGVGDRVGLLERGRDADFVLWSGDPLDLRSSIEAVFIDGQRVHGGER